MSSTTTGTSASRTRARSGRSGGTSTPSTPNLARAADRHPGELPEIFSWGVAYKGLPKTLIDVDLRYFDYANTELFGQKVIDGGLGWRSVFAVAMGDQYQATDRLTFRAGYLYNTNPIPQPARSSTSRPPESSAHALHRRLVPADRERHALARLDPRLPERDRGRRSSRSPARRSGSMPRSTRSGPA